jgi:hypothetical protein
MHGAEPIRVAGLHFALQLHILGRKCRPQRKTQPGENSSRRIDVVDLDNPAIGQGEVIFSGY